MRPNSVPRPKPHSSGILRCCKEMDMHLSWVIYVGNAPPTDARAVVDAQCHATSSNEELVMMMEFTGERQIDMLKE